MTVWYFYLNKKGRKADLGKYGFRKDTRYNGSVVMTCDHSQIEEDGRIYLNQPSSRDIRALMLMAQDGLIEMWQSQHKRDGKMVRLTQDEYKELMKRRAER